MIQTILGKKANQSQRFLEDGTRIPVTAVFVGKNPVVAHKTQEKNGYMAAQLGFGIKKKANKAYLGHTKGAKLEQAPFYLREVEVTSESDFPQIGEFIDPSQIFKPGDIVDVVGVSKGKGYAGVVKRWQFKGGPRTHGQSDRERAPGSIGQTTTPGRVYKGKKMAGRMGHERVTIKNLEVVDVDDTVLLLKGLIPGFVNSFVMVTKIGEKKKFVPLYKEVVEEKKEDSIEPESDEKKVDEVENVDEVEKVDAAEQGSEVVEQQEETSVNTEEAEVKKEETDSAK